MDLKAAIFGANMAISELLESGRIGSIAVNKEIIFPFTALEFEVVDEETGISGASIHASTELLEAAADNKSLTFTFDGANYLCPANYLEGMGVLWGNGSFFGMEDTGEPFAFGVDVNNLQTSFLCITGGIHTAEISLVSETVKPIDPKYLPSGGGVKVIKLNDYKTADGQNYYNVIETLYMSGGGSVEADVSQFLADANTDGVLIMTMEGLVSVRTASVSVFPDAFEEGISQISASIFVDIGMGASVLHVLFSKYDSKITVAVTPIG